MFIQPDRRYIYTYAASSSGTDGQPYSEAKTVIGWISVAVVVLVVLILFLVCCTDCIANSRRKKRAAYQDRLPSTDRRSISNPRRENRQRTLEKPVAAKKAERAPKPVLQHASERPHLIIEVLPSRDVQKPSRQTVVQQPVAAHIASDNHRSPPPAYQAWPT
jgi:hypothetical protein